MKRNPRYPSTLRSRAEFLRKKDDDVHTIGTEHWDPVFTCWCGVEQLSGKEYRDADAVYWEDETKFIIRYRKDVSPDMRIRLDSAVYEITSITDRYNRHEALEILARKVDYEGSED